MKNSLEKTMTQNSVRLYDLKNLSDQKLLAATSKIVLEEKRLTSLVLEHLQEIENRKVYCDLGIESLFKYCTQVLKYSEAEASVRVNATRLIKAVPKAKEKIDKGELNLTNASAIQRFFRANQTPVEEKDHVIEKVKGKSTRDTNKILDEMSDVQRKKVIILNERLLNKLEKIQKEFGDCSELEAIEALLDQQIQKMQSEKPARKSSRLSKNQRYIPRKIKEKVYMSAHGRCQFVSKLTGKRCECRTNLQYDHIRPVSERGQSNADNLRLYCFQHNQRARIRHGSKVSFLN